MLNISLADQDIIKVQIGREPQGIAAIAVRAKNKIPVVLQMQSIVDDKPFPTLYWLCSKDVSRIIGTIETQGWVKDIEDLISRDSELREAFYKDHQGYVAERESLMTEHDRKTIKQRNFTELFKKYGIGGISHWDKVRCLHMQYAHHLAKGNVIGQLLDNEFELYKMLDNVDLK